MNDCGSSVPPPDGERRAVPSTSTTFVCKPEYCRTTRISCHSCKRLIARGALLFTLYVESPTFEHDFHFHFSCFWRKLNGAPISETELTNLNKLRYQDRERIRSRLHELRVHMEKRRAEEDAYRKAIAKKAAEENAKKFSSRNQLVEFSRIRTDIAKSSRGKCGLCKKHMGAGEIKMQRSGNTFWSHPACLLGKITEGTDPSGQLFAGSVEEMGGFGNLCEKDQMALREFFENVMAKTVPAQTNDEDGDDTSPYGHPVLDSLICEFDDDSDEEEEEEEQQRMDESAHENQTTEQDRLIEKCCAQAEVQAKMFEFFSRLNLEQMNKILAENARLPTKPMAREQVLGHLVDMATFGCPALCSHCSSTIVYSPQVQSYACTGYKTEYTRCAYTTRQPQRTSFVMRKTAEYLDAETLFNRIPERTYALSPKEAAKKLQKTTSFLKTLGKDAEPADDDEHAMNGGVQITLTNKRIVKQGTYVDADFSNASSVHVYADPATGNTLMAFNLTSADVATNSNSFFRCQLLEHDDKHLYFVFRSWGRVGSQTGHVEISHHKTATDAMELFEKLFQKKTRNEWKNRKFFQKRSGYMQYVETEFAAPKSIPSSVTPGSMSTLPTPVKKILLMIFDEKLMKETMVELNVDIERMPLGNLTHNQLMQAYSVLREVESAIAKRSGEDAFVHLTSKFYTLVPHNLGTNKPPLLNTKPILKEKTVMVDSLLAIHEAFKISADAQRNSMKFQDPVDQNYLTLKCSLEVLPSDSPDYEMVMTYAKNTHGATHDSYRLNVLDILKVHRDGEADHFKADLGNRMLLWHGSRTTNFVGILKQGLRIAPPEAPAHGYMFGKGIYFTDMVSKSANYCHALDAGHRNASGLLLLCEVALGKMRPEKVATTWSTDTVRKHGIHSIWGMGQIRPSPDGLITHSDGYQVNMGVGTQMSADEMQGLTLLYNEYIVYDVTQVRIRYLVHAHFTCR